ncbi:hypothetical protein [Microbacterium sp. MYb64]|uniref:hypothetical protein n=1 Tax=Microbacterium sp. MYb64 TaxID=1848691 RepID=UPI000CFB6398|nr:hypothetical protein [Microbacterium sp. MYb64]PRB04255.1 hypothetical protein CQ044_11770 [Microbacterium sp. MYb64]
MSEIDEGPPPNVHHARPERTGYRHAASARRHGPEESDDPYAKPGEDPYGKRAAATSSRRPGERD